MISSRRMEGWGWGGLSEYKIYVLIDITVIFYDVIYVIKWSLALYIVVLLKGRYHIHMSAQSDTEHS